MGNVSLGAPHLAIGETKGLGAIHGASAVGEGGARARVVAAVCSHTSIPSGFVFCSVLLGEGEFSLGGSMSRAKVISQHD